MESAGVLAAFKNYFHLDQGFLEVPQELIDLVNEKAEFEGSNFNSDTV